MQDCLGDLPLLEVETIVEGPGGSVSFELSPSGRLLAYDPYDEVNRIRILDLISGKENLVAVTGDWLVGWLDEATLIVRRRAKDGYIGDSSLLLLDRHSGETTKIDSQKWEYTGLDESQLRGPYYTGWQASDLLSVPISALCGKVRNGTLETSTSVDGSLLLSREEILDEGPDIVQDYYPDLATRQELLDLAQSSERVVVYTDYVANSPFSDSGGPKANMPAEWSHWVYVLGRSSKPYNVALAVASLDLWKPYAVVPTQHIVMINTLWEPRNLDVNPNYLLGRDACFDPDEKGYGFVLYRRGEGCRTPQPLGILPYPHASGCWLAWSPDGSSLFFDQEALGRYSISRLDLDSLE